MCGDGVGKCVLVGWESVWWSGVRGEYLTLYTRVFEAVKVTVSA